MARPTIQLGQKKILTLNFPILKEFLDYLSSGQVDDMNIDNQQIDFTLDCERPFEWVFLIRNDRYDCITLGFSESHLYLTKWEIGMESGKLIISERFRTFEDQELQKHLGQGILILDCKEFLNKYIHNRKILAYFTFNSE